MSMIQFFGALEIGLIYSLVALGVLMSFRILDFPDLTADGSFPLGAALSAILLVNGVCPLLATGAAVIGGASAGFLTAWLNVRWKISHLLASILTMTSLYAVNLRVMGRPNLALLNEETLFTGFRRMTGFSAHGDLILIAGVVGMMGLAYWWFMVSEIGLALRATGANPRMARAQGISTKKMVLSGMALSNGLIALAGSLFAQSQGFADITMGIGTIIFGLAAVIIGEVLLPSRLMRWAILGAIAGSILYRLAVAFALNAGVLGLQTSDQNLVVALLIGLALVLPQGQRRRQEILK